MNEFMPSYEPEIPEELIWRNRPIIEEFSEEEPLYLRFESFDPDLGTIDLSEIRYPDQSFNRGKISRPEWVLLHDFPKFRNWGYGKVKVGDIPKALTYEGRVKVTHEIKVEHVPIETNYSHSEARGYKEEDRVKRGRPKWIRNKFRTILSQNTEILKMPDSNG